MGREVARQSLNCILTVWAFFLLMLGVCVSVCVDGAHLRRLLACGLWHVACISICGTAIAHLDIASRLCLT